MSSWPPPQRALPNTGRTGGGSPRTPYLPCNKDQAQIGPRWTFKYGLPDFAVCCNCYIVYLDRVRENILDAAVTDRADEEEARMTLFNCLERVDEADEARPFFCHMWSERMHTLWQQASMRREDGLEFFSRRFEDRQTRWRQVQRRLKSLDEGMREHASLGNYRRVEELEREKEWLMEDWRTYWE